MTRLNSVELIVALIFIVLGLLLLAGNLGLIIFNWGILWALVLVAFGGWLIWRAFRTPAEPSNSVSYGVGDYAPHLVGKEIRKENFSHGLGDMDVDLSRAVFPEGQATVRASHGLGDLTVIVPRDLAVRVKARAGLGDARLFDERADGFGPSLDFQSTDYVTATRKLDLEASVGLGAVKVVRAR